MKHTFHNVWSPQLGNRRDVDIYLPASYDRGLRHPVIYMQDGQNLSDPATAFAGTWQLESTLAALADVDIEPIVVGVHNHPDRLAEYSPFPDRRHGGGKGDAYLAFLSRTLKPRVDRAFRTYRRPSRTAIVGSSMGGVISLYAWFRWPTVFGLAAAMSPALWYGRSQLFDVIARSKMPRGRLYVDMGTAEGAVALADVRALQLMISRRAVSERLVFVEDRGGRHDETAWGRRLGGALAFLFESER